MSNNEPNEMCDPTLHLSNLIKTANVDISYHSNNLFCATLSEFENFLLCERILINLITCQNETSNKF
jgi:hypothetical protein